jgi:hypothetical protein
MATTPGERTLGNEDAGAATQAKEKAQETAQQAAGAARGRVREQVDQRSTDAGQKVSGTASDAREIAQQLRQQGKEQPAKLAEQAADRAERLGDYLQRSDADRILQDVEDFGRRQPMAVMFGGLALGFAASRFLKASSQRRENERIGRAGAPHAAGNGMPATTGATVPGAATAPPVPPVPPVPREQLGGETPPVPGRTGTGVPPAPPASDVSLTGGVRRDAPERPGDLR